MLTDERVFDDDHYPPRLLHCSPDVETLPEPESQPSTVSSPTTCLCMVPPAVGKTVLTRYACRQLERETGTETVHVRCRRPSTASVAPQVLQQLPGEDPVENTGTERLVAQLRKRIDRPMVVVLNEADDLPASNVLRELLGVGPIGLAVICHDLDEWLARIERNRLRQSFAGHTLGLDRYRVHELADILEARARQGLADGVWERRQLERIADDVAGVARDGIQTLREAARQSARCGY